MGVASLLCAFLFTPVWNVNPLFGSVFEIGFAGGHGTAGGMASVFMENFKWQDGGDLGMTTIHLRLNDRANPTAQQPFNSICAKAVFPQHLRVLGGVYPALQQN